MENLWHNSSLEGAGFVQMFLPTNAYNQVFFNNDWMADCLSLWVGMPNCQFWDFQWTAFVSRCIKHCMAIDWECFLPVLFSQYLNMFEWVENQSRLLQLSENRLFMNMHLINQSTVQATPWFDYKLYLHLIWTKGIESGSRMLFLSNYKTKKQNDVKTLKSSEFWNEWLETLKLLDVAPKLDETVTNGWKAPHTRDGRKAPPGLEKQDDGSFP
eukprot:Gb_28179 [translate_table: standard]